MSTWKNIHTDPPTPGVGIRVTDGQSVFVGHITQSRLYFTGTDLSDGTEIVITPDALTEWMPLPAPQEAKTLEELGYRRHDGQATHLWGSRNSLFYYEKKESGKTVSITYNTVGYERPCVKVYVDEIETNTLFTDEILAVARLIEEMEAEDG